MRDEADKYPVYKKYLTSSKDLVNKASRDITDFQKGLAKCIKTPYDHLNDNMLGGLYPGDILTICGVSGSGKTYTLQIIEEFIFDKTANPDCDDYILVRCNWEMSVFKMLVRKLSRKLKISMYDVLTKVIKEEDRHKWKNISDGERNERIYYCEKPLTTDQFKEMATSFLEEHKDKKRVVFSVDHLALGKGANKKQTIDTLVEIGNELRKDYDNVNFIYLSQFNRDIEKRTLPKDHAPNRGDLYQTDCIFHMSDVVLCSHIPSKLHIDKYMSLYNNSYEWLDEYKTDNKKAFETKGLIFYHYLKIRDMDMESGKEVKELFIQPFPKYKYLYGNKHKQPKTGNPYATIKDKKEEEEEYVDEKPKADEQLTSSDQVPF